MHLRQRNTRDKNLSTDLLAVFVTDTNKGTLLSTCPKPIKPILQKYIQLFQAKKLKCDILIPVGDVLSNIQYIFLGFQGLIKFYKPGDAVRILASRVLKQTKPLNLKKVSVLITDADMRPYFTPILQGMLLGFYTFDKYKSSPSKYQPEIEFWTSQKYASVAKRLIHRQDVLCESVNHCRDLINEPGDVAIPETFAKHARSISKKHGLTCEVLNESDLKRLGYPALIAVGKGSIHPPRLITMKYKKRGHKKHLLLIGKGITFDTGGISIKPANEMWEMKGDMSGGAAVLFTMEAIARLDCPVNVTAIIATAENAIGSRAQMPGNIFFAKNGKSIHVDNTDAEGRLVLTDAFARAEKEKADYIVDIATLTGACVRALGTEIAGVMGNTQNLIKAIQAAGKVQGEEFWELPLFPPYKKQLECPHADLNNIGTGYGGAITAGLFLQEFIPDKARWAHLDIAGPFITTKPEKYFNEGATGFGVRTFVELALNFKKYLKP
ncbi:leucyl aminopeptidase [PVC group bacterium]|nr:leucyl aminopeptidase [PVC group bacterium]